jgi:hypothetical protein
MRYRPEGLCRSPMVATARSHQLILALECCPHPALDNDGFPSRGGNRDHPILASEDDPYLALLGHDDFPSRDERTDHRAGLEIWTARVLMDRLRFEEPRHQVRLPYEISYRPQLGSATFCNDCRHFAMHPAAES